MECFTVLLSQDHFSTLWACSPVTRKPPLVLIWGYKLILEAGKFSTTDPLNNELMTGSPGAGLAPSAHGVTVTARSSA